MMKQSTVDFFKRSLVPSTLVCCALQAASTTTWAQKPESVAQVRAELEAISRRAEADIKRKDVKAYLSSVADDYQGEGVDGSTWNKKQAGESLARSLSVAKSMRGQDKTKSLQLDHGKAVVLSQEHTTVEVVGSKTGKIHTVVFNGTWRNTWIKKNGTWQVWRQKQLTREVLRDGVPVPSKPKPKP